MSKSLIEMQTEFVDRVAQGEFVAVMEDYYADDVFQIEGDGSRRETKEAIIAFEHEFLGQVKSFMGVQKGPIGVSEDDGNGNGVTFAEYSINAIMTDGSRFAPKQVQVTVWRDGKIVELRYYYDPSFGA